MRNYYFVVPSLPPLSLGVKPGISFEELMARLEASLRSDDLKKVGVLRLFVDLCNIRSLLMEEEIDPRGNLTEKELDEALLVQSALPDYVFEVLSAFEKTSDKIRNFSAVLARFFAEEALKQRGFLRKYLTFEREWRLVFLGLRAKQLGRDLSRELQFEEGTDPFIAHLLAQKDSDRYDPPAEYTEIKELTLATDLDPWHELQAFSEYRFRKIGELVGGSPFGIDQVLAYVSQLVLVENLHELDEEKGKMILDTFKTG